MTHDPNAEWRGRRCMCSVCSPDPLVAAKARWRINIERDANGIARLMVFGREAQPTPVTHGDD